MTTEQFRRLLDARPFQPFIVHLAGGGQIAVNSREFIMPSPSGRTFAVAHGDDTISIIDLLLVDRLETKPVRNGAQRRRRAQ